MKEEGISTVLVNPNIATVQTSEEMADKIYFLPVTPYFVEKVIEKEKPDGILLGFGGQTALNCGVELEKRGILKKHNVKVLGTPVRTIELTEDRALFNKTLAEIDVRVPKSFAVTTGNKAIDAAKKIGYPVIVRAAFALGGQGSGSAKDEKELREMCRKAFTHSPQVLVEENLKGWKEIEYEVVRDKDDNCVTVCNMENFDPMGIHTGESIVVAPSQTLTNSEYHKLREVSIRTIRHLGIVGECNIQFAFDPFSEDYRVIEVNARLSRSSALASKATGYPLAFVAAKLGLGYPLHEIKNSITKKTMACFEPALDYCVVKMPRWDLQKFRRVSRQIGTEMKSVGEVMAIGRTFEEAMQKAIRMLNIGMYGLVGNKVFFQNLFHELQYPTDKRVFAVINALIKGASIDRIHSHTKIDKWFLERLKRVVDIRKEIKDLADIKKIGKGLMLRAKKAGFSDVQISLLSKDGGELDARARRKELGVLPFVKQIDTLAAEYPAETNYLYVTYNADSHDIEFPNRNSGIVLGSGPYSIGSSVEFDWCCVNSIKSLSKAGYKTTMINFNPETVSTDYDICDRLYFEELSVERVLDVYDLEQPKGVIVSSGGQIPNNLAMKIHNAGVNILGTSPKDIDRAEDRNKFSALCDELGIGQPEWASLDTDEKAMKFAGKVGFPVLVRPSYVLSGAAMTVAFSEKDLKNYLKKASAVSEEYPVVMSKFILDAKEIEIDAVAKNGILVAWAITEHVENAGVHSGDATMVLPPQTTYLETMRKVKLIARKLAKALNITGPFNIQFIAKDNEAKVIECNLRASRSFPFVSKVARNNFIGIATKAMLGMEVPVIQNPTLDIDYVGVKAPQFSFSRLRGADPVVGVEMASTGEVACLGKDLDDAFLKAILATKYGLPKKNILISINGNENRYKILGEAKGLAAKGYNLFGTKNTAKFFRKHKLKFNTLYKLHEKKQPNIAGHISSGKLDFVICVPNPGEQIDMDDKYELRRMTVDYNIPLVTNLQLAKQLLSTILNIGRDDLEIKSWDEYS